MVFADNAGRSRFVIGSRSGDLGPELSLYDRDGNGRVDLGLTDGDDPILSFRNAASWRIMLGAIHGDVADRRSSDDWGLRFKSEEALRYDRHACGEYGHVSGLCCCTGPRRPRMDTATEIRVQH